MDEWVDVKERNEKKKNNCVLLFYEIQSNPHMLECVHICHICTMTILNFICWFSMSFRFLNWMQNGRFNESNACLNTFRNSMDACNFEVPLFFMALISAPISFECRSRSSLLMSLNLKIVLNYKLICSLPVWYVPRAHLRWIDYHYYCMLYTLHIAWTEKVCI